MKPTKIALMFTAILSGSIALSGCDLKLNPFKKKGADSEPTPAPAPIKPTINISANGNMPKMLKKGGKVNACQRVEVERPASFDSLSIGAQAVSYKLTGMSLSDSSKNKLKFSQTSSNQESNYAWIVCGDLQYDGNDDKGAADAKYAFKTLIESADGALEGQSKEYQIDLSEDNLYSIDFKTVKFDRSGKAELKFTPKLSRDGELTIDKYYNPQIQINEQYFPAFKKIYASHNIPVNMKCSDMLCTQTIMYDFNDLFNIVSESSGSDTGAIEVADMFTFIADNSKDQDITGTLNNNIITINNSNINFSAPGVNKINLHNVSGIELSLSLFVDADMQDNLGLEFIVGSKKYAFGQDFKVAVDEIITLEVKATQATKLGEMKINISDNHQTLEVLNINVTSDKHFNFSVKNVYKNNDPIVTITNRGAFDLDVSSMKFKLFQEDVVVKDLNVTFNCSKALAPNESCEIMLKSKVFQEKSNFKLEISDNGLTKDGIFKILEADDYELELILNPNYDININDNVVEFSSMNLYNNDSKKEFDSKTFNFDIYNPSNKDIQLKEVKINGYDAFSLSSIFKDMTIYPKKSAKGIISLKNVNDSEDSLMELTFLHPETGAEIKQNYTLKFTKLYQRILKLSNERYNGKSIGANIDNDDLVCGNDFQIVLTKDFNSESSYTSISKKIHLRDNQYFTSEYSGAIVVLPGGFKNGETIQNLRDEKHAYVDHNEYWFHMNDGQKNNCNSWTSDGKKDPGRHAYSYGNWLPVNKDNGDISCSNKRRVMCVSKI
ncbi:hypothetical protein [Cysteiniphilum sp. JM-1]|uniref:hypothetical protein n=1 Tax=Cysteiniphilum sp. JM-1 TaxID=2610891 RepID=UPI001246F44E|nr:hypothetical protein [Cysteiniphilum sp. JM-1]